jgi:hypothetical protein
VASIVSRKLRRSADGCWTRENAASTALGHDVARPSDQRAVVGLKLVHSQETE